MTEATTAGRSSRPDRPSRPGRPGRLDPDELAALEEQRDFLLASLADLDREHDAGDLDDEDHAGLRDEYTARAAEVLRAIDEQRLAFAEAKRPRDRRRLALTVVLIALFALGSGALVARSLGARKPGETSSGGISVKETTSQRAQKCIPLIDSTMPIDPTASLDCFREIIAEDPENVVALTWSAWQLSLYSEDPKVPAEASLTAAGIADRNLTRSVELQPSYSQARAFRAVVAFRTGRFDDAEQFLADFYANDPDAESVATLEEQDLAGQIAKAQAAEDDGDGGGPTTTTTAPAGATTTTTGG